MREQTIGDILKNARIQRQLSFDELEIITKIPSHLLLAMELDQFVIVPEDMVENYLEQYAKAVDLDAAYLLEKYQNQESEQTNIPDLALITENVKEKQNAERPKEVPNATYIPISQMDGQKSDQNRTSMDNIVHGSRASRYKTTKKSSSYVPIVLLCLIALAILAFVFFIAWNQLRSQGGGSSTDYSVVNSSQSSQTDSTLESSSDSVSSTEPSSSITMTTEVSGSNLAVNLTGVSDSLDVIISLSGAENSWVSVTGSETGDSGTLLSTAGTTSYTATLPLGTTTSLITLGVTQGVSITIDGQELDMSGLASTTVSYITLNIQ